MCFKFNNWGLFSLLGWANSCCSEWRRRQNEEAQPNRVYSLPQTKKASEQTGPTSTRQGLWVVTSPEAKQEVAELPVFLTTTAIFLITSVLPGSIPTLCPKTERQMQYPKVPGCSTAACHILQYTSQHASFPTHNPLHSEGCITWPELLRAEFMQMLRLHSKYHNFCSSASGSKFQLFSESLMCV